MPLTDSALNSQALVIKNETILKANTALRVGTMLQDIIDNKINNDKISTNPALGTSNTLVPSQAAVRTYVNGRTLNDILTAGRMSTVIPYITAIEFGAPIGFGALNYDGNSTFSFMDGGPNDIFRIKDEEITIVSQAMSVDAKITSSLLSQSRTFNLPNASGTLALTSNIPATPTLQQVLTAGNVSPLEIGVGAINLGVSSFGRVAFSSDTFTFIDSLPNDIFNIKDGELNIFSNAGTIAAKITSPLLTDSRTFNLPDKNGTFAMTSDLPKRYIALISQTGTANPTVTVIKNDFSGTISVTRNAVGDYRVTNTLSEFTNNKTSACINNSTNYAVKFTGCTRLSDTIIAVATYSLAGGGIAADTLLLNDTIVIEVYP